VIALKMLGVKDISVVKTQEIQQLRLHTIFVVWATWAYPFHALPVARYATAARDFIQSSSNI